MIAAIKHFWRGEVPLADAFWYWAVLGGALVNGASSAVFFALISLDQTLLAIIVGYVLSIPYNLFAMVGVWRAADRYAGPPLRADVVRIVAVVFLLVLCVT